MTVMILSFTGGAGLKTGCHTRDNYWAILPDFEKKQPQKGSGRRASISKGKGRAKSVMVRNNDLQKAYEDIENQKNAIFISLPAASNSHVGLSLIKHVVSKWIEEEVVDNFLTPLGWQQYIDTFITEGVDGELLLNLTREECEDDLGMVPRDANFLTVCIKYCNHCG